MKNVTPRIIVICSVTLLIGLTLSVGLFLSLQNSFETKRDRLLSNSFNTLQDRIRQEVDRNFDVLYAIKASYLAHNGMSRKEFASYAHYYTSKIPSIQALEWVPAIKLAQRDSFELATREEGFENFEIFTRSGDSTVRAEDRPIYYPVYYIEPFEENKAAFGFDPGPSSTVRQNAIDQAIKSGVGAASEVINILQKSSTEKAILTFVPVYKPGTKEIDCLIEGVYLMDELINTALKGVDLLSEVEISITDNGNRAVLLYGQIGEDRELTAYNSRSGELRVADQTWELKMVYTSNAGQPIILPFWVLLAALIITGLVVKLLFDILTDNRKAVLSYIRELEQTNQDLEQYAYVASHDLQEPLHSMQSLVTLIEMEFGNKLGPMGNKYLSHINAVSKRMSNLISNLLNYSRIGHSEEVQTVDLAAILDKVKEDLSELLKTTETSIETKTELPVLRGFPTALGQLFQNLITNAIKFQSGNDKPIIQISAEMQSGFWLMKFKDNGIGIPKEYQSQIFIIFKRLHTSSKFPGTGVGLANCKKIVELHHGTIWVESEEGQGSEFCFTLMAE
ncbi:CHASE domain-containing protein [Fulvivirga sp.]|uniref:CHASE domain-containing protein n=1 Tax=Fulvivirga sp. TaxID=1931237 RepID=UPI0032EF391D